MDTATTARRESTAPAGVLYVGLELSAREWRLACSGGLATRGMQTVIRAGDRPGWQRAIGRAKRRYGLAASAPVWMLLRERVSEAASGSAGLLTRAQELVLEPLPEGGCVRRG